MPKNFRLLLKEWVARGLLESFRSTVFANAPRVAQAHKKRKHLHDVAVQRRLDDGLPALTSAANLLDAEKGADLG
jgi:hypothetical protein